MTAEEQYRKSWTHRILRAAVWVCCIIVSIGLIHDMPNSPVLTGIAMTFAIILMYSLRGQLKVKRVWGNAI